MFEVFFQIGRFLGNEAVVTVSLCILACVSVAIVMRFFVKPIFRSVDDYMKKKYEELSKTSCVYASIKSVVYTAVAFVLTGIALAMLMKVCVFPVDNSPFLAWLYFIPMVALQYFLDRNMKRLANRAFGLEDEDGHEEAEEKVRPPRIYTEKARYTIDEEGRKVYINE